ncbi:MAG TPA: Ig-like domain-containing protein [Gemmatimonadaceae bacterium]|nr:Ig-like domain-containing protein [Gemmatimonadaceae bacterium]
MIRRRALTGFLAAALTSACASPGIPPGGPVDTDAPKLIGIAPDSGATGISPKEVRFRFDELVTERPQCVATLNALFLISPRDGEPRVDWHRSEIAVRPRRGWKANTPYTVTMLPGISDLRGNVRNIGGTIVFSTGATIPTSFVAGTLFNWVNGAAVPRAYIEARPSGDTTIVYVAVADSTGAFRFPNLPPDTYRLRGIIDENNNKGLDPREAWDTATVTLRDSLRAELFAFPHDSVAPRVSGVVIRDSVTLEVLFDHALDPTQQLTAASISIKRADSTVVPVTAVTKPGAPTDSTGKPIPTPFRRVLPSQSLLVTLGAPVRQATILRVRAINIRGLDRISGSTERVERIDPNPPVAPVAPPSPPPASPSVRRNE